MKKLTALALSVVLMLTASPAFCDESEKKPSVDVDAHIATFNDVLDMTVKRYAFDITKEELLQAAVEELIRQDPEMFDTIAKAAYTALDENSYYLTAEEFEERAEDVTKQFQGIGVSVSLLNGKVIITMVHKNTPAIVKGLKEGDIITAVNGEDISGYTLDDVVSLIRGEAGTHVMLTVDRNGMSLDFMIPRAVVTIETVSYENLGKNNSGYIKIDSFSANTLNEFNNALNELTAEGVDKVILDLRYNQGGYLATGVGVASAFVPKDKVVVHEDYKGEKNDAKYVSVGDHKRLKVVVLVNEYSASASEIVTGAIKEYKLGPVVGTKTFGKGTVQSTMRFINAGATWLTVAQYNLPSGKNIHGVGIEPDYIVENTTKPVDLSKFVPIKGEKVLKLGDEDEQVLALKQHLSVVGFSFVNMNEKYDDELCGIVEMFQGATELFPYGVADLTTQAKIKELAGEALEVVDNQLEKAKELIFKMK